MKAGFMKIVLKVLLAVAVFSAATMITWNAVMPDIFNVPKLSFHQAMTLLILTRFLFGGFGVLKDIGHYMARKERRAILESWHAMTPEERAHCIARARTREACRTSSSDGSAEQ
ncbi:hypothetical protein LN040_11740 [Desulfovibrio subterraneus]|jgi:hypothetical protein|uniref:hypothetical protein n=1 Tax=Desulfovibrio subterraneus TaxID=2718620 RepID=UPI0022B91B77|nr:hypothetical protein [Desulfovibrio subterraneus]WBF66402.1 hypothetical protein LN040_11740 [Desulfovibrio subterraneus]